METSIGPRLKAAHGAGDGLSGCFSTGIFLRIVPLIK
jgi:hypothetical protein